MVAQVLRGLGLVLGRHSAGQGSAGYGCDVLRGVRVPALSHVPRRTGLGRQGLRVRRRLVVRVLLVRIRLRRVLLLRGLLVGPVLRLPVRPVLVLLGWQLPRWRAVLLPGLRAPGPAPRLPAGGGGLVRLSARRTPRVPGGTTLRGQHDTFVRGPCSGKLPLVTLSALRHRDSYV